MTLYHCRRCLDDRFVLVRPETNEVVPCRDCNLDQWERWNRDEFAPTFHRLRAVDDTTNPARAERLLSEARESLKGKKPPARPVQGTQAS